MIYMFQKINKDWRWRIFWAKSDKSQEILTRLFNSNLSEVGQKNHMKKNQNPLFFNNIFFKECLVL